MSFQRKPMRRRCSRWIRRRKYRYCKSGLGSQKGLLSWKLDGLTIVLTYEGGELVKAVTRGNGEIGEVITNNARVFPMCRFVSPIRDS